MTPTPSTRLQGRIAVVTGASRGIGAAVARAFAREGATVVLCARTTGALEEVYDAITAAGGSAVGAPMDVTKPDQIAALGANLGQRYGRIDILVGNAAQLGTLAPIAHSDSKAFQATLDVNLTANYHLIQAFDPLLRQSDAGRVIFVTSGVGRQPVPYFNGYAVSKAGLDMLARLYAAEVAKTPIKVNLLDPGVIATGLRAKGFPGEDPSKHPDPDQITESFLRLADPAFTENGSLVQAEPEPPCADR